MAKKKPTLKEQVAILTEQNQQLVDDNTRTAQALEEAQTAALKAAKAKSSAYRQRDLLTKTNAELEAVVANSNDRIQEIENKAHGEIGILNDDVIKSGKALLDVLAQSVWKFAWNKLRSWLATKSWFPFITT